MTTLKGKTVFITGASRGIGEAIALKCAADGANVVIAAKSSEPHPKLPGTIHSVAEAVERAGGRALAIQLDVRDADQITSAVNQAASHFGGIDILVNNAGAIKLTGTDSTPVRSYDLMTQVNVRATFLCSQACLPYLEKSNHAHILNLSPPISLEPKWLENNVAYTITKYGMSLCTLGMASEFRDRKISVNSLWPRTAIATAAITWLMGDDAVKNSRKPEIMADAAYEIFITPPTEITGQHLLDEDFLRSRRGIKDFSSYSCVPGNPLMADFYVESVSA
jgi:NAD(P)-dependent dehydrogenase (short-subunit alcohol dehydrogenase family)